MMESKRASLLRLILAAVVMAGLLGLSGCASKQPVEPPAPVAPPPEPPSPPAPEPPKQPKIKKRYGKPYTINGKTYRPLIAAEAYAERGFASWYGSDFHGKDTACGQPYDMYSLSAAHKILPLHTWVQVTNLESGQSLVLQINDRGPFISGRVIDLSYAAAESLGIAEKGVATVTVEALGPVPTPQADKLKGTFYVQVGAYLFKDNADIMHARMLDMGYAKSRIVKTSKRKAGHWRVQAGPFETLASAKKARSVLSASCAKPFILMAKAKDQKGHDKRRAAFDGQEDWLGAAGSLYPEGQELTVIEDAEGTALVVGYEETAVAAYGAEGVEGEEISEMESVEAQ